LNALRKLQLGVPQFSIRSELIKRGFQDPSILEWSLETELPKEFQEEPIALEFTEIYLDEQAFMEHAGSRDYLDGYGVVMNPALHYTIPKTIRLGTPSMNLIEKILEPVLKEEVIPLPSIVVSDCDSEGVGLCHVWKPLSEDAAKKYAGQALLGSLDCDASWTTPEVFLEEMSQIDVLSTGSLSFSQFCQSCTTFVVYPHPFLENHLRVFFVLPLLSNGLDANGIATVLVQMKLIHGELFMQSCTQDGSPEESWESNLKAALLQFNIVARLHFTVIQQFHDKKDITSAGYVLHEKAGIIHSSFA
jgi:hypothetical protein